LDKQSWVAFFENALPGGLRKAVPVPVKELILGVLARGPRAATPHRLEEERLPRAEFEAAVEDYLASRPAETRTYFATHRERFYEIFNAVAHHHPDRTQRFSLLEVGVSENTALYRRLFPAVHLTTLDRPVANMGTDDIWNLQYAKADRHYNADLNIEVIGPTWGDPPLGTFDWINCTEVIEHLVLHPVDLLQPLVSLLSPGGRLYLTTPNFFRRENLQRITRRENPQAVYPRRGENWDAHHHFHEYGMDELRRHAVDAGGRVVESYYSRCWDGDATGLPEDQRANLL
jgi:SAM-dependent methyltransferase